MSVIETRLGNSTTAVASKSLAVCRRYSGMVHQHERRELWPFARSHYDLTALCLSNSSVAVIEPDETSRIFPRFGNRMMFKQSNRPFLRSFMIIHVGVICEIDDVARLPHLNREPDNALGVDAESAQGLTNKFNATTLCHVLKIRWQRDGCQGESYIIVRKET